LVYLIFFSLGNIGARIDLADIIQYLDDIAKYRQVLHGINLLSDRIQDNMMSLFCYLGLSSIPKALIPYLG
jgi:hypothetical protein